MIAVVTVGEYSDRAVEFVEHPDREELLTTLRSLAPLTGIEVYAVSEHLELLDNAPGEQRSAVSLAHLVQPHLTAFHWPLKGQRVREDILTALPATARREALMLLLDSERVRARWLREQGRGNAAYIAEGEALMKDLEARLA